MADGPRTDRPCGSNELVERQFSRLAGRYETSAVHAQGQDLGWMVSDAALTGQERVLDVGTGAGHTALALAPGAWTVTGIDLTADMIARAAQLAERRALANVQFVVGDVVRLPFPADYFDRVACRFAAHHFVDPDGAAREISRVLRPGGRLLLIDHIAPDDGELDAFINRVDWLRDPSHVREWTAREWAHRFQQVDIPTTVAREWDLTLEVGWWLEQAGTPGERRQEILQMLRDAPPAARDMFSIRLDQSRQPVSFVLKCALFTGRKAAVPPGPTA
ncbi:MAG: methyltransferase domain-containing protein [Thermaerobacter sp.]|nr:methyltransferase domain-containing protein [Thermaerobacter sp.]